MKTRTDKNYALNEKRMLSLDEACAYVSVGMNSIRAIADKADAIRKYGKRILVDRIQLDRAIDNGLFD